MLLNVQQATYAYVRIYSGYTGTWLPVLQVLPVHPPAHLQVLGAMQVPPLRQAEHTAVYGKYKLV